MQWLWSFEQLAKVCRFKKGDTRRSIWAIQRLYTLYPERAVDVLFEVIRSGDIERVDAALKFFNDPLKKHYAPSLRELYQRARGRSAGLIAAILSDWTDYETIPLFLQKYPGSVDENIARDANGYTISLLSLSILRTPEIIELTAELFRNFSLHKIESMELIFLGNLRAGASAAELLRMHLDEPELASLYPRFLEVLAEHCDSTLDYMQFQTLEAALTRGVESEPELVEEFKGMLDGLKKHISRKNKSSLPAMLKKKEYKKIVDALYHKAHPVSGSTLNPVSGSTLSPVSMGKNSGDEKAHDLMSALEAFSLLFDRLPTDYHGFMAYQAIYIYSDLLGYQSLIGVALEELPPDRQWEKFLEERLSVFADIALIQGLKSAEGLEKRIEECFDLLGTGAGNPVVLRIIQFLGSLSDQLVVNRLMEFKYDHDQHYMEISRAMSNLEPVVAFSLASEILENSKDEDWLLCALDVLAELPLDETVQLLLDHWENLFTLDKDFFLTVLSDIGDKRFLKKLKEETHDYEEMEWETYHLICLVNGIKDPWVKKMGKKVNQYKRHLAGSTRLLLDGDRETLLRQPVYLELQCRRCRRTLNYKVQRIQVVPETLDIYIYDPIKCKHCNAFNHYLLSENAMAVILPLFGLLIEMKPKEEQFDELVIVPFKAVTVDGGEVSQKVLMEEYREKLAKRPEDPALLIGFGNVLNMIKCSEDAGQYYELALKHDADAVDAYFSLGNWVHDRGRCKEAHDYYWKVADILHTGNYHKITDGIEEFKLKFAFMVAEFARDHKYPTHPNVMDIVMNNQ